MKKLCLKSKRFSSFLIALLVTALIPVSVYAYFIRTSTIVKNVFIPAVSDNPEITETFSDNLKENVFISITDKGYPVYVRSAIVITWQNKNGNVYYDIPVRDVDYELITGNQWTYNENDNFFYYDPAIQEGSTDELIISCKPLNNAPDENYTLSVNIISQTVQAVGTTDDDSKTAQQDAWGLSTPIHIP